MAAAAKAGNLLARSSACSRIPNRATLKLFVQWYQKYRKR